MKSIQSHLTSTLRKLYDDKSFTDVTIVCDDFTQLQAHKIVLSASSPKLRNLLSDNIHPSPVIFMMGINKQDLLSILQFIYFGECYIEHGRIENVLEIAQKLQIEDFLNISNKEEVIVGEAIQFDQQYCANENTIPGIKSNIDEPPLTNKLEEQPSNSTETVLISVALSCKKCKFTTSEEMILQNHQETDHSYSCDKCAYNTETLKDLKKHQEYHHKNARFNCEQCGSLFSHYKSLKFHEMSIHRGLIFPCTQCGYQANQKVHLKRHVRSKHQ